MQAQIAPRLSARVGASVKACAVQIAPLARAGNGDTDHGARAFADGGTAETPRRRDAGAEGGIPLRSMRPPVRMDAQDYAGRKGGARSGGETFPANAPRATAGCIGPKAERTDAKSRAPLSGRPRRQSSDCREMRRRKRSFRREDSAKPNPKGAQASAVGRNAGCAFRAGVPLGRCSPQIRARQPERQGKLRSSVSRDVTQKQRQREASDESS